MKQILIWLVLMLSIDSARAQRGTWTWVTGDTMVFSSSFSSVYGTQGIPAPFNKPGSRTNGCGWKDYQGNYWVFGGYGRANGGLGYINDLWRYNFSTGYWTWDKGDTSVNAPTVFGTMGSSSTTNKPGGRAAAASWTDSNGNLWLYGGYGYKSGSASSTYLGDMWKFDLNLKQWIWMQGDSLAAWPVYGTKGVPSSSNYPGARTGSASWTDSSGNFWLFGGQGTNGRYYNDLWKFNLSTTIWTWVSGSSFWDDNGVYGTKGLPSVSNIPCARADYQTWIDNDDNLWLFGGFVNNSSLPINGSHNDLWKYNPSSNEWTWLSGDQAPNMVSVYGTRGVSSATNRLGARSGSTGWIDINGSLWVFSGRYNSFTYYSDIWKFDTTVKQWTWIAGDSLPNKPGWYGTIGTGSEQNKPGARSASFTWSDSSGNFWVFGGRGNGPHYNDLWKYQPGTIVSLHLLSFNGRLKDNSSVLYWSTENEQNTSRFIIERSIYGRNFEAIGEVKANSKTGTNVYSYSDPVNNQPSSVNAFYYRLKMLDNDGKFTYSNVVTLTRNQKPGTITIYPNPAKDKVYVAGKNITTVKVIDASGRVVLGKTVAAIDNITLDVSKLTNGVYQVQVLSDEGVLSRNIIVRGL